MRTLLILIAWAAIIVTGIWIYRGEQDYRRLMNEFDDQEERRHQWTEDDL